jgi:hypothetical protein
VLLCGAALIIFLVIGLNGLNFAQDPAASVYARCDEGSGSVNPTIECLDHELLRSPALIHPWMVVLGIVLLALAVVFAVRSKTRSLVVIAVVLSVLCLVGLLALHTTRPRNLGPNPYVNLNK